jgi:hypothetical protein
MVLDEDGPRQLKREMLSEWVAIQGDMLFLVAGPTFVSVIFSFI